MPRIPATVALANHKTVFRADFKPRLEFYPSLFPTASSLSGYKDWLTTGLSVTLQDFDERTSFSLAHSFFVYARDMKPKEDSSDDARRLAEIVAKVPSNIGIEKYERLGLRCWFLHPVDMKFEQLVFVVADKFLLQNKEIREGICPSPTDAAYAVHFREADCKVVLRAGPMRREETEQQFQPDRNVNFAVKERVLPSEDLFANIPGVSLLIDIDVSQNDIKGEGIENFLRKANEIQDKLSKNIVQYVLGRPEKRK